MKPYFLGLNILQVGVNKPHIRIRADFSDGKHYHVKVPASGSQKEVVEALHELATKIDDSLKGK